MGFNAVTMSAKLVLFLSMSFLFLSAQVFSPVSADDKPNICAWKNAMPVLYHTYGTDVCKPRFVLKNGVDCQDYKITPNYCASYCEMKTTFYYGQERPYSSMPMCTGGLSCTLSESRHVGYSIKIKINGNFKKGALTAGITGGWNTKTGQSESFKYSKSLKHDECGYFTFIPIHHDSCGTYSAGPFYDGKCDVRSVGNACSTQTVTVEDHFYWFARTIRGVAVFVYLNCTTLEPLPDEHQEAPFNQPNVRLPRGLPLANAYQTMWNASLYGPVAAQSDVAVCDDHKTVNATDCFNIFEDLFDRGADMVPMGNAFKGQGVTIGNSSTCAMYLNFDEDWTHTFCLVSLLEVSAAAQNIYDTCTNTTDGMVGGSHVVRPVGNCGATVAFVPNPVK